MPTTKNKEDTDIGIDTNILPPKSYRVIMLNDDYTTQNFVIEILVEVFHKNRAEATTLMFDIHNEGRAIVGVYPYDIAITKVRKTINLARRAEFPLRCLIEEI